MKIKDLCKQQTILERLEKYMICDGIFQFPNGKEIEIETNKPDFLYTVRVSMYGDENRYYLFGSFLEAINFVTIESEV